MLNIQGEIITIEQFKELIEFDSSITSVKEILELFFPEINFENFDNTYKILIFSEEQLKPILDFFKKYSLNVDEKIQIRKSNITLKRTYEILKEYEHESFIDKITVEQFDKNEFISFDAFTVTYNFLKKFHDSLPNNPSNMDIIINAYDYVKKRKYNRAPKEDDKLTKLFSSSILTDYIVCPGFVKQFNCILTEYNIPCYNYDFIEKNKEGHTVSLVNIENFGVYVFDITKDSFNENKTKLENKTQYSGFMIPFDNYIENKIEYDNFEKQIFEDSETLIDTSNKYKNKFDEINILFRKSLHKLNISKDEIEEILCQLSEKEINSIIKNISDDDIESIIDQMLNEEYSVNNFKNQDLLDLIIDVNSDLLRDENFFVNVSNQEYRINSIVYDGLAKLKENLGCEFESADFFIDSLINAKRNTELSHDTKYILKSVLSRFENIKQAIELTNLVLKKIK